MFSFFLFFYFGYFPCEFLVHTGIVPVSRASSFSTSVVLIIIVHLLHFRFQTLLSLPDFLVSPPPPPPPPQTLMKIYKSVSAMHLLYHSFPPTSGRLRQTLVFSKSPHIIRFYSFFFLKENNWTTLSLERLSLIENQYRYIMFYSLVLSFIQTSLFPYKIQRETVKLNKESYSEY